MTTYAGLILLAFMIGVILGRFERADRRVTHERPHEITQSLHSVLRGDRIP